MKTGLVFSLVLALAVLFVLPAPAATVVLNWTAATDDMSPPENLVYEVRHSGSPNIATLEEIDSNGLVVLEYGAAREQFVAYDVPPGDHYYNVIVKDTAGNRAAYAMARVWVPDAQPAEVPPRITYQPVSQNVRVGQPVTFAVVATGTPPPTYQWIRSSVLLPGATGSSYRIDAARKTDNNATFMVKVSNPAGTVTSTKAILHVRK